MRCQSNLEVGSALREARQQQGLSQRSLALRAGTSQDAISRIERGVEASTLERFGQLMLALGRRPVLSVEPLESPVPGSELAVAREMTAGERLREARSWNLVASRLTIAGEQARGGDHPARRQKRVMSGAGKEGADRPLDLGELIATLARHGVDYLVIGGVATQVHGHRRTTMDFDLTPDPSPANLRRLGSALVELDAHPWDAGAEKAEISVGDPERLALTAIVPPLLTRHGQIHILREPKGARGFDEMRERALVVDLDGVEVAIVSLDDLIRMKRAAGRPADLDDIAALTEVERQRRD
jgi:transcriptional regulator with XRE-family HTH domain